MEFGVKFLRHSWLFASTRGAPYPGDASSRLAHAVRGAGFADPASDRYNWEQRGGCRRGIHAQPVAGCIVISNSREMQVGCSGDRLIYKGQSEGLSENPSRGRPSVFSRLLG